MEYRPKVNEINEFLEIASDFEDPLELIRESLSNSYDAGATDVLIRIRTSPTGSDITIEDDGEGMSQRDLESFFDLGNSRKTDGIGYKGHGTKIFYKSDGIKVNTSKDGTTLHAEMDRPWEKLNNRELPTYSVTEHDGPAKRSGTQIKISGFKSGEGFSPESLTYNKVHNYLKWKTIAGSTAHFFEDDPHDMNITVDLDSEIDDTMDELRTTNHFEFPSEQQDPGKGDFPEERMCKHYGPTTLNVPFDGGCTAIELVGMIGGKAARDELPTYGRHSTQFGIWLAKDHIKIERLNEAISHDNEFIHFLFVANCQDIELSANRGKIRNKASKAYQAIEEELNHYLSKVARDPWFKEYLEIRKRASISRQAQTHTESVSQRKDRIRSRASFEPTNTAEILLALQQSNSLESNESITVEDYQPAEEVETIVRRGDELLGSSLQQTVVDFFESETPLGSTEQIIAWELGDLDKLREVERKGYLDAEIECDFDKPEIRYRRRDEAARIEILLVKPRFHRTGQLTRTIAE
ncbi:ATP-binding protein [Salinigranum sp. GCM10025319]|uniref:ATP-binding protein n=1 Tax=Salinigranum sp. GCM10025319 TaxID=3252687 RepID=UPI0036183695